MYKVNDLELINPENFKEESAQISGFYKDRINISFYCIDNQYYTHLMGKGVSLQGNT